jgi:hypothetical protein
MKKRKKKNKLLRIIGGITIGSFIGIILIFVYWKMYGWDQLIKTLMHWALGVFFFGIATVGLAKYLKKKKIVIRRK